MNGSSGARIAPDAFAPICYYRLNVMSLRLPPLRERRGDILPLSRRAILAARAAAARRWRCRPAAEHKLLEPRLAGQRARAHQYRTARGLARRRRPDRRRRPRSRRGARSSGAAAAAALPAGSRYRSTPAPRGRRRRTPAPAEAQDSTGSASERERELILATLRITGGSRNLAAERLGISPRTLALQVAAAEGSGRLRSAFVPNLHYATA